MRVANMTSSVLIRPHLETDAPALHAAVHESMAELVPWMPWCHPDYTRDEALAWIRTTQEARRSGSLFDFAIVEHGAFAGGCGINNLNERDGVANLGYWIRTSRSGRGVVPEAVRQLVAWTFENTRLNRLEIVIAVENVRSQRVAEKVGAEREALLKKRIVLGGEPVSAVLYSIVRL
jgi:ribosomal-protein-serine acetyltransferase